MFRRMFVIVAILAAILVSAPGVMAAKNVAHYQLVFSEESLMELSDEGAECAGYSGTISEERNYDIRVTEFVDGPNSGRVHLSGFVTGPFTVAPHDPDDGPVYTGTISEKITFSGMSFDDPLVVSFIVRGTATGSDGSVLKLLYHGHGVYNQGGEVKIEFDKFTCIA